MELLLQYPGGRPGGPGLGTGGGQPSGEGGEVDSSRIRFRCGGLERSQGPLGGGEDGGAISRRRRGVVMCFVDDAQRLACCCPSVGPR